MHTTTRVRGSAHLSRHERQRLARAEAFSRATPATLPPDSPLKLGSEDVELIDRLVRRDRTAVSTALIAIAGIGGGAAARRAVLARLSEATRRAQAEAAISPTRAAQIARHLKRALGQPHALTEE